MKISIIVGSTREGRFGSRVGSWLVKQPSPFDETNLIELADLDLPWFTEAVSPAYTTHDIPKVNEWRQIVKDSDAFIWITPEYNRSYGAPLKNAIDWLYAEWNRKPVGIVSYGSAMGARAIEHLKNVAVELQMAPNRFSFGIANPWLIKEDSELEAYNPQASALLHDLHWWSETLKK